MENFKLNKIPLFIPKGIKFLSEWKEFSLPDYPCIINKQLTGCGFTEYVIRSPFNAILVSPRKPLLVNKSKQHNEVVIHPDGTEDLVLNLYYARCDKETELGIDKDLTSTKPKYSENIQDSSSFIDIQEFKNGVKKAINYFNLYRKPIKICVTYDSFRKVREVLEELNILQTFNIVVDEFQSILDDGNFKPTVEMEFLTSLKGIDKLCFVSATPMMDDAIEEIPELRELPYIEMDWEKEDKSRIIHPDIEAKSCRRINEVAKRIITEFKEGKFKKKTLLDKSGKPMKIVEARELVFFINSVRNICDIIRQNKLTPEMVNIICSKSGDNSKKIREAFKNVFKELGLNIKDIPKEEDIIGEVPVPDKNTGEYNNKPITLCTKTVYLGADFYSKCARSIVLSDSNINCLAVDITLDIPQILGRQRDEENPWKNSLEIWFISGCGPGEVSEDQFNEIIKQKDLKTADLLLSYESTPTISAKSTLVDVYQDMVKTKNYKDNYIGINYHAGSYIIPQINNIVRVAEKRAFRIQQKDYKDRVSVFNRLEETFGKDALGYSQEFDDFVEGVIRDYKYFPERMRQFCYKLDANPELYDIIINFIPEPFKMYILSLGTAYIISIGAKKNLLDKALESINSTTKLGSEMDIATKIFETFKIGDRISKADLKIQLQELYDNCSVVKKAKAIDIENWFEIKRISIVVSNGKRGDGFELISKK